MKENNSQASNEEAIEKIAAKWNSPRKITYPLPDADSIIVKFNNQINQVNKKLYCRCWSSATPGYIIFLVDQSGAMNEIYYAGKTKAEFIAETINSFINTLINIHFVEDKVINRVFISLIGYGGKGGDSVNEIRSDYLSQFAEKPLRIETGKQKVSDGNGGLIEIDVCNLIFIEPIANGVAPLGSALELAKKLLEGWLSVKPNSPAPIVINISGGGMPNGTKTDEIAKAVNEYNDIVALNCEDGNPLIFNAYLGDGTNKSLFPKSENELKDENAFFYFKLSSRIPELYNYRYEKFLEGGEVFPQNVLNSRGFILNETPEIFLKFIEIGS